MLLTKKETAKRLGISPPTVDRLVRDGEISAVEFYGRRRYPEASVTECYQRHMVAPTARPVWSKRERYYPGMKLV